MVQHWSELKVSWARAVTGSYCGVRCGNLPLEACVHLIHCDAEGEGKLFEELLQWAYRGWHALPPWVSGTGRGLRGIVDNLSPAGWFQATPV